MAPTGGGSIAITTTATAETRSTARASTIHAPTLAVPPQNVQSVSPSIPGLPSFSCSVAARRARLHPPWHPEDRSTFVGARGLGGAETSPNFCSKRRNNVYFSDTMAHIRGAIALERVIQVPQSRTSSCIRRPASWGVLTRLSFSLRHLMPLSGSNSVDWRQQLGAARPTVPPAAVGRPLRALGSRRPRVRQRRNGHGRRTAPALRARNADLHDLRCWIAPGQHRRGAAHPSPRGRAAKCPQRRGAAQPQLTPPVRLPCGR